MKSLSIYEEEKRLWWVNGNTSFVYERGKWRPGVPSQNEIDRYDNVSIVLPDWALNALPLLPITEHQSMNPDHSRLAHTMRVVATSTRTDVDFFLDELRKLGMRFDNRFIYADENIYMREDSGLWQEPKQFATLLSFLANQKIDSYCEVGTLHGWTFGLISAVLSRNSNQLVCTGIDPIEPLPGEVIVALESLGVKVVFSDGTSDDFIGTTFDLVLVDGDHTYGWVKRDWDNTGRFARICLFHDINCHYLAAAEHGDRGPGRLWDEIVGTKLSITTTHPVMGIGVMIIR